MYGRLQYTSIALILMYYIDEDDNAIMNFREVLKELFA